MKFIILLPAFLLTPGKYSIAQSLTGNWKGTSLCQVKNSPCHDENVVYHITKGRDNNTYQVDASKIIDGKEDDMGTLNFSFDPQQKILFSVDSIRQVKWSLRYPIKKCMER